MILDVVVVLGAVQMKVFLRRFEGENLFDVFAKVLAEKEVDERVVSRWRFDEHASDHSISWKVQ